MMVLCRAVRRLSQCGVRVEDVDDPLMRKIRYLDKLADELAKGKSMDRICGRKGQGGAVGIRPVEYHRRIRPISDARRGPRAGSHRVLLGC